MEPVPQKLIRKDRDGTFWRYSVTKMTWVVMKTLDGVCK
jgi:hypothetical protein